MGYLLIKNTILFFVNTIICCKGVLLMNSKESLLAQAGESLKKRRTVTGESVHKVAKKVNISGNYLSEIERGIKEPSDVVLEAIGNYYQIDRSEIFALYNRIAPEEAYLLAHQPALHRTITQMSLDERLTREERELIAEELQKLYENLINER